MMALNKLSMMALNLRCLRKKSDYMFEIGSTNSMSLCTLIKNTEEIKNEMFKVSLPP